MHEEYILKGRLKTETRDLTISKCLQVNLFREWKLGVSYYRMGTDKNKKQKKIHKQLASYTANVKKDL